eukprot:jgi/Antlo1/220/1502
MKKRFLWKPGTQISIVFNKRLDYTHLKAIVLQNIVSSDFLEILCIGKLNKALVLPCLDCPDSPHVVKRVKYAGSAGVCAANNLYDSAPIKVYLGSDSILVDGGLLLGLLRFKNHLLVKQSAIVVHNAISLASFNYKLLCVSYNCAVAVHKLPNNCNEQQLSDFLAVQCRYQDLLYFLFVFVLDYGGVVFGVYPWLISLVAYRHLRAWGVKPMKKLRRPCDRLVVVLNKSDTFLVYRFDHGV